MKFKEEDWLVLQRMEGVERSEDGARIVGVEILSEAEMMANDKVVLEDELLPMIERHIARLKQEIAAKNNLPVEQVELTREQLNKIWDRSMQIAYLHTQRKYLIRTSGADGR